MAECVKEYADGRFSGVLLALDMEEAGMLHRALWAALGGSALINGGPLGRIREQLAGQFVPLTGHLTFGHSHGHACVWTDEEDSYGRNSDDEV